MEYFLNPLFHVQENLVQDSIYCQAYKNVNNIKEGDYFFDISAWQVLLLSVLGRQCT
jgi:hypothetical protein